MALEIERKFLVTNSDYKGAVRSFTVRDICLIPTGLAG